MTPEQIMQEIEFKQGKLQGHREAWFKKDCNSVYHDHEIQTLRDELQELYLRVEATPEEQIKLIRAEAAGKEIEVLYKDQKEWKTKTEGRGDWDFRNFYRVKAGQEETENTKPVPVVSIPATEAELEYIKELVFDLLGRYIPLKTTSEAEIQVRKEKTTNMIDVSIGKDCFLATWYVFNPVSKCWEDWDSKPNNT